MSVGDVGFVVYRTHVTSRNRAVLFLGGRPVGKEARAEREQFYFFSGSPESIEANPPMRSFLLYN